MPLILEDENDIQVEPLSSIELVWAKKLDTLLGKMPARLQLIEVDGSLELVDDAAATAAQDKEGAGFGVVRKAGAVLANISNGTLKVSGMTH